MPPVVPIATYRLQLSAAVGFDQAAAIVRYLRALGISHLYASPFLKARAGSQHGYDIVDHGELNPEFGGEQAFARLADALAAADMGLILDFVPNHMGVGHADNRWWLDVLEWGAKSPHAASFDIDWDTLPYRREGGLLLPILGKPYGETLEQGEIALTYEEHDGSFTAWYFDHRLPIRPDRYAEILRVVVAAANAADEPAGRALLALADRYSDPGAPTRAEAPAFKVALAAVDDAAPTIERGLHVYRPDANDPLRAVALHRLLERQHYRLAHWRVAFSEVNYRRFFDINDLAGIRVEDAKTFVAVHRLVARLIAEGRLHGLRLDHIDGLSDPAQYCRRLQRRIRAARQAHPRAPPFYVVAEKILADGEAMPRFAGIAGTTGYEALNLISRLLLDDSGLPALDRTWSSFTANTMSFDEIVERAKIRVIEAVLASEFTVLARLLARIAAGHWPTRDYTLDRLRAALQLFVVCLPVYRTYVSPGTVSADDRATIARAIEAARARWYGADIAIFDFLKDALTLDLVAPGRTGYSSARVRRFAAKVQQFTGPVMAKALEDTAFYRYHRLLALNEVGADPSLPGLSVADFHRRISERAQRVPHGLTATATHDTKRGEDARARILALSELANDWAAAVERWRKLNALLIGHARHRAPSPAHEYMIYQALLGAWPLDGVNSQFVERMQAYLLKAAREGKQETSWIHPNETYERTLTDFLASILDREQSHEFLRDVEAFARRVGLIGALNALSQVTLKSTMPGVPDFYQGTELWDFSLVDPDNRRPVDFARLQQALAVVDSGMDWPALARKWPDGYIKLALTRRLVSIRRQFPALFSDGPCEPIEVTGPDRNHVVAFARWSGRDAIVVAVGRHFASKTEGGRRWPQARDWNAALSTGRFDLASDALRDDVVSRQVSLATLFSELPVAVLRARRRR